MDLSEVLVDAIHEGKIVKVPQSFALREGMLILKKSEPQVVKTVSQSEIEKNKMKQLTEGRLGFDDFRRPLDWRKKQVVQDLVDNYHWIVARERKAKNMTRKQLGNSVGVSENEIKLIENGTYPFRDYVLINKIQSALGINLRRDDKDFSSEIASNPSHTYKIPIREKVIDKDDDYSKRKSNEGSSFIKNRNENAFSLDDDIEIF